MREWYLKPTIISNLFVVWERESNDENRCHMEYKISVVLSYFIDQTRESNDKYYVIHTIKWERER